MVVVEPDPAGPEIENGEDTWLPLHTVSALLGVSASTVRRWAAAGRIPERRTAGGHRRFDPRAVQALVAAQAPGPPDGAAPALPLVPPAVGAQPWHIHLGHSPGAGQMRELGQRLLGLLIQYLVWSGDDSRFLADARTVGASYGAMARAAGGSMSETVQAFLYFRTTFWRMALQIPPVAEATDAREMVRIAERIEQFMDGVLVSTITGYEQAGAAESPARPA